MKTSYRTVLLISALPLLSLVYSCKSKPYGRDHNGDFIYVDSCIRSHTKNIIRLIPMPKGGLIPMPAKIRVCDSSVVIKEYIATLNK